MAPHTAEVPCPLETGTHGSSLGMVLASAVSRAELPLSQMGNLRSQRLRTCLRLPSSARQWPRNRQCEHRKTLGKKTETKLLAGKARRGQWEDQTASSFPGARGLSILKTTLLPGRWVHSSSGQGDLNQSNEPAAQVYRPCPPPGGLRCRPVRNLEGNPCEDVSCRSKSRGLERLQVSEEASGDHPVLGVNRRYANYDVSWTVFLGKAEGNTAKCEK